MKKLFLCTLFALMLPILLLGANGYVEGQVVDDKTGEPLSAANVILEGTTIGSVSDIEGYYTIIDVPEGDYMVSIQFIGYETVSKEVKVVAGEKVKVNFSLKSVTLEMDALEVLASRANKSTPVAYSNVEKEEMELRLGSQDIPMILNTTPSVYSTQQGGGAGDARVSVRGFNQRNVAIMINGVPVNDMENGWVYWSNWDGIGDATSSIQMQRGLSAVNLATPSIGGTMNIITDPTARSRGGNFKQEFGAGNLLKSTLSYNSGMIGEKLALSGTIVRKKGDGVIDKAWTDAWAYYFGASYALNKSHRLEFYALGAPQRHGQMRYKQNAAAFSHDFAKDELGYSQGALDAFDEASSGRFYNENWNTVSSDYKGQQYFYMYGDKTVDRHDPDFLNESENYYHKPQVNMNWFWTLSEQMRLSTVAYFSGGSGGGTGTFDDMIWDYSGPSRSVDFDGTIAINEGAVDRKGNDKIAGQSVGFLRNSINRQWTLGAISKFYYKLNDNLTLQAGIDWRTAEIEHMREVRDLLGGNYVVNANYDPYAGKYNYFYNEFDRVYVSGSDGSDSLDYAASLANATGKELGDAINYNNTNTVDWTGVFTQGEYKTALFSVYGMFGYSMIKYSLVDYFKKADNYTYGDDGDGHVFIESDWISNTQIKGGGLFNLSDNLNVFGNFGFVQKAPILDNVIDDTNISLSTDPQSEQFNSYELGLNLKALRGKLTTKFNFYYTDWKNRSLTRNVDAGAGSSGDTDIIFLTGMNQNHKGIEAEIAYAPMQMFRLDMALSYGIWEFTSDASGDYKSLVDQTITEYEYAIDGLKVGDMPQTIVALGVSVFPIKGLTIQPIFNLYDRHWADWDPGSREISDGDGDGTISDTERDAADREQSWKVPGYNKLDLHLSYNLPIKLGSTSFQVFMHVFNVLDNVYVQDATDNSAYNGYSGNGTDHSADDAEVYLGTPRYWNVGLKINL